MFYCRRLCQTSRTPLPVRGQPGAYQLYLAFQLVVDPGQTTSVDVGLIFKMTDGYYPMVVSDSNSLAHGILVNSFNTLVETTDTTVSKLEFTIINTGLVPVTFDVGHTIARLLLVQTGGVKITEVDHFPENEATFKRQEHEIESVPKTESVWFKRMLKEDFNDCFKRFFDTIEGREYMTRIEAMQVTPEYINNPNQSVYKAKWVWENIPELIKKAVRDQFHEHKKQLTIKIRGGVVNTSL